ncbi:MAG: HupE/UreJ family protein [Flavisolibacter sp.]
MTTSFYRRSAGLAIFFMMISISSSAHVVINELDKMSKTETATIYLQLGFEHILPMGMDHILFVISLFLLSPKLKPLIWQSTTFTLAHTITLAMAMYRVVTPVAQIVEPLISLSIVFVAMENIFSQRLKPTRIALVFLFGLVHGLGFASSLSQMGLPQNAYLSSLLMFNIGVELGQLTVILLVYFLVGKWFGEKNFYRKFIVLPVSLLIIAIAGYWTVERLFL